MNLQDFVLAGIAGERAAQDELWGEQNHPDGTSDDHNAVAIANEHRDLCKAHAKVGTITWADIAKKEFFEALAETDPKKLMFELTQCAAVLVAWQECILRREEIRRKQEAIDRMTMAQAWDYLLDGGYHPIVVNFLQAHHNKGS